MRRAAVRSAWIAAILIAAAPAVAQAQLPRPKELPPAGGGPSQPQVRPQAPKPEPAPPAQQAVKPRPYKPVAAGAPPSVSDPTFEAFRTQLGSIAERKDRAALAKLVVAKGFFWEGEKGDKADPKRSGIDNLSSALGLAARDGFGWDALAGFALDPTGAPMPDRKDAVCSPADPEFDPKALEELAKATGTDELDWGYPVQPGLEVRAAAQPNSPVIGKLGADFVWVAMDESQTSETMLRIVTPSGQFGFVAADAIAPLGGNQLCYVKEGGGWKILGVIGEP